MKFDTHNIITNTDSYKFSHWKQMPPESRLQSSYIESRGGEYPTVVNFGLQMFLDEYMCHPITRENIERAEPRVLAHGEPFNREGWEYILNNHGGYLPLKIEAVPEGTVLPVSNALVQVINTDSKCYWLPSYIETAIHRATWYPNTVATRSWYAKLDIYKALLATSDEDPDVAIQFKLHDFGARGVSSQESAAIGGSAHLVNFMGTDTYIATEAVDAYYAEEMAGFSIPASEHSTMTSWGGPDKEIDAFRNMLKQFAKPGALVACVSDSYDIYRAVNELWGDKLKQEILDSEACLIVRPDSGDPTTVPIEVIQALMAKFGFTVNSKGYKVLHPSVRVIQGDGITDASIKVILANLKAAKLSVDNIAFGMGGGLLQQLDRDTQRFAMKCSALQIEDTWIDVWKDPITDPGKSSKRGVLAVVDRAGLGVRGYQTIQKKHMNSTDKNLLEVVYLNGKLLKHQTFSEIRQRAHEALVAQVEVDRAKENGRDRY